MPIADYKAVAVGSAALTIALAWNEAVTNTIRKAYPQHRAGASIVYACAITLIVIIVYSVVTHAVHYAKKAGNHASKFLLGPHRDQARALGHEREFLTRLKSPVEFRACPNGATI